MEIFNLEKISYTYKNSRKALDGVSFRVQKGESLTIIGTNGSGKSTLLYILDGLLMPESGSISAFGKAFDRDSLPALRERISLLFQNPHAQLFLLSVWDELCFGPSQMDLGRPETEKRAEDILALLGIAHLKDMGPWDLSGGEIKKVALGTCLSINPDVLLLDEPTTGLDPRSQVEFVDLINELRAAGKTVITATHDLGIIEDISDRTIVIGEDHSVLLEGLPGDVMENTEALLQANLIHRHVHRHSWYVHEHSHFGTHGHEHVVLPAISETPDRKNSELTKEVTVNMTDMEKLKRLLEHWAEHNEDHAKTYLEWAKKAEASGNKDLNEILNEIAQKTKMMEGLFERARRVMSEGK